MKAAFERLADKERRVGPAPFPVLGLHCVPILLGIKRVLFAKSSVALDDAVERERLSPFLIPLCRRTMRRKPLQDLQDCNQSPVGLPVPVVSELLGKEDNSVLLVEMRSQVSFVAYRGDGRILALKVWLSAAGAVDKVGIVETLRRFAPCRRGAERRESRKTISHAPEAYLRTALGPLVQAWSCRSTAQGASPTRVNRPKCSRTSPETTFQARCPRRTRLSPSGRSSRRRLGRCRRGPGRLASSRCPRSRAGDGTRPRRATHPPPPPQVAPSGHREMRDDPAA
jgi:hypothetical protein